MVVVVAYSWARDADGARVHADGTVEWRTAKTSPGEDDHAAVAVALGVAQGAADEVVGVTAGEGDPSWALARGVGRAVAVADAPALDDEAATAAVLAAAVRAVPGAGVVVVGDAEQHPLVAPALAAHLGWPALLGVTSASAGPGGIEAVRRSGDVDEAVAVAPPVVLGVRAQSEEAHPPGMKELLLARKRPVERLSLATLGVTLDGALASRGTRLPDRTGAQLFTGDPEQAAAALVAALRAQGVA